MAQGFTLAQLQASPNYNAVAKSVGVAPAPVSTTYLPSQISFTAQNVAQAPTTPTPQNSTLTQSQALQQLTNELVADSEQGQGLAVGAASNDILSFLQNQSAFTAAQDTSIANAFTASNNPAGGFLTDKNGGNTAREQADWLTELEQGLSLAPPSPQPVVASSPAPLTPISPPPTTLPPVTGPTDQGGTTPTDHTTPSTPAGTTTNSATPSTSTTSDASGLAQFASALQAALAAATGTSGITGSGATGTGTAGAAPAAGNVPGTNTPISSLGALTPIGTPTTSSSSGNALPIIIVVVTIAGAIGVWIYERRKKKQGGAS